MTIEQRRARYRIFKEACDKRTEVAEAACPNDRITADQHLGWDRGFKGKMTYAYSFCSRMEAIRETRFRSKFRL